MYHVTLQCQVETPPRRMPRLTAGPAAINRSHPVARSSAICQCRSLPRPSSSGRRPSSAHLPRRVLARRPTACSVAPSRGPRRTGRKGYHRVIRPTRRTAMISTHTTHNLAVLAEEAFDRLGDYESLIFESTAYRSGELVERARRASSGLVKLGVDPGERVVVLMANCPEVPIAYNAIWRCGAVVTPVVFLISPPELTHILTDSAAVAVVTSPELLATVTAAAAGSPALRHVIVAGGAPEPGSLPGHVRGVDFAELETAPPGDI